MEDHQDSKKRNRRRSTKKPGTPSIVFPLLLAATANNTKSVIKKCLAKLHHSLLLNNRSFPNSILSLIPTLMSSKCAGIACRSVEIVGLASLVSLEMNEMIVLDGEIVKGLVLMLGRSKRKVSIAACNALLDLATTFIGRQRLLELSALERLMFLWIQFWFLCAMKMSEVLPVPG